MPHRPLPAATLLALALQLVVASGAAGQLVLCSGPRGHVALEVIGGDCCTEGAPGRATLGAEDACADCIDTPLLRATLDRPPAGDPLRAGTPVARALSALATNPVHPVRARADTADAPPRTPWLRRTVVLLI